MTQSESTPPLAPSLSDKLPKLIPRKRTTSTRESPSAPPPPTPPLPAPPNLENHTYITPSRRILSPEDHRLFLSSDTCTLVEAFIYNIADSVRGRSISSISASEKTPTITTIVSILQSAEDLLSQHPPKTQAPASATLSSAPTSPPSKPLYQPGTPNWVYKTLPKSRKSQRTSPTRSEINHA
ncbi:hypothetical protein HRS9139_05628 [Pyrenophora teres f. teres]|nr:hypothetical protein HRS9139_05628 [Pyrenophora teres f. teres]